MSNATISAIFVTFFLTMILVLVGWGWLNGWRNHKKEMLHKARRQAVEDVFGTWQWKVIRDSVNELEQEKNARLYEQQAKKAKKS